VKFNITTEYISKASIYRALCSIDVHSWHSWYVLREKCGWYNKSVNKISL